MPVMLYFVVVFVKSNWFCKLRNCKHFLNVICKY